MTSRLGTTNLIRSASSIIVTSEAVGYLKENAYSWKTAAWWKSTDTSDQNFTIDLGSAMSADCAGMTGHNLGTITGSWTLHASTDNFVSSDVTILASAAVTEDITIFKSFTSTSYRYWRFTFTSLDAQLAIGNLFLSVAVDLEYGLPPGFSPAHLNRDRQIFNNKSEGGHYLGRAEHSKGAKITISQPYTSKTWIDANWLALADHIELYPFYLMWDSTNEAEAAYCMANDITYPSYVEDNYLSFSIECGAIYDV